VATAAASIVATIVGYQVGSMWSFFAEETVRLRTNHLSYRAFYLPWSRHAILVLSVGFAAFWLIALIRYGLPAAAGRRRPRPLAAAIVAASLLTPAVAAGQAKGQDGFLSVNGITLHYVDWGGSGPALLFLTGLGDSAHAFDGMAPAFTDAFHVL